MQRISVVKQQLRGHTTMSGRGLLFSVGVGVAATFTGLYVVRKVKDFFRPRQKMKLFHKPLCMSTRCAWLISELGAEEDFDLVDELPGSLEDSCDPSELLMLQDATDHSNSDCFPVVPLSSLRSTTDDVTEPDYPDSAFISPTTGGPRLPAVVVNDEFTMIEGAAICMYLADLYGQFLPPVEYKAEYYSWIVYSAATFDNIIKSLHHELVECPESRRDHIVLESASKGFHAFARALSDSLDNRDYLCGKSFTAADCVVGFTVWWAHTLDGGHLLADHPSVVRYLDRLRARPAFRKTFGARDDTWDWGRYFNTCVPGIQAAVN